MTAPINIAVIGFGYWGPNLVRNFSQLPDSQLTWCCDRDPNLLETARNLYPDLRTTTEYTDILHDPKVQAVAIATPAMTHYSLAKEFLQAGKDVLVEKPLSMSTVEASDLIQIAKEHHKTLMVGHTFEYNPAVLKIKELLQSGELGDLHYIYSSRVNLGIVQRDLNALWSIAPHDISIFLFLLEQMPTAIRADGGSFLTAGIHDVVFLHLSFPGNLLGQIHVSWLDPAKNRKVTLVGSKKMIIYDDLDNEAKIKVYNKGVFRVDGNNYGEFQYKLHSGDIYIPRLEMTEPLKNECQHFIDCLRSKATPRSDGESGLRVIKVLEAAQESLTHEGIKIPLPKIANQPEGEIPE